jgi:hypothetical protein
VISGAGNFVKSGTGTTVLSGSSANTFTGHDDDHQRHPATRESRGGRQLLVGITVTSDPTGVGTLALGGSGYHVCGRAAPR